MRVDAPSEHGVCAVGVPGSDRGRGPEEGPYCERAAERDEGFFDYAAAEFLPSGFFVEVSVGAGVSLGGWKVKERKRLGSGERVEGTLSGG